MPKAIHDHPDQCLPTLAFQRCTAGWQGYFETLEAEFPKDAGDCAVIAVASAARVAYSTAHSDLTFFVSRLESWKVRLPRETTLDYLKRRLKQCIEETFNQSRPKHRNPIHGTNTNAYSNALGSIYGFELVFGEPCSRAQYCLCSAGGNLVVDGRSIYGGEHVAPIINGVVGGDFDITDGTFHVIHAWRKEPLVGRPYPHGFPR